MLAPPKRTLTLGGESWTIRPPRRALDVLEVTIFQHARFASADTNVPSVQDMQMVCEWVAAHVVETSAGSSAQNIMSVVDEALDWPSLVKLRTAIVELASIDKELVDGVKEYWRVSSGGGCECPCCKDGKQMSKERRKKFCLYERIDDTATKLASQVIGFTEDPDPSQPYWLFQLKQARLHGKLEARAESHKRRKEKEKKRQLLKEKGLI